MSEDAVMRGRARKIIADFGLRFHLPPLSQEFWLSERIKRALREQAAESAQQALGMRGGNQPSDLARWRGPFSAMW